jgi:peptidoglycan/xylan/chitin deacetylase (PgdA/CDA1 family)
MTDDGQDPEDERKPRSGPSREELQQRRCPRRMSEDLTRRLLELLGEHSDQLRVVKAKHPNGGWAIALTFDGYYSSEEDAERHVYENAE